MGLALIAGAPLLGCLLVMAVDRVLGARCAPAAPAAPEVPAPRSEGTPAPSSAPAPAGEARVPVAPRRRHTPEDDVARTIRRVGCGQEVVDRVMARADVLGIDGATMWLWMHVHGVTGLVLALDAGLRHEEMCEHLDSGSEPDWATLGGLAGLAADLGSTDSCLAVLDADDLA